MNNIKLSESEQIHNHWDADQEKWLFSVIDIFRGVNQFTETTHDTLDDILNHYSVQQQVSA